MMWEEILVCVSQLATKFIIKLKYMKKLLLLLIVPLLMGASCSLFGGNKKSDNYVPTNDVSITDIEKPKNSELNNKPTTNDKDMVDVGDETMPSEDSDVGNINWTEHNSPAGFSFKYPVDFLQYDNVIEELLGVYSPEDNTETISLTSSQDCYDGIKLVYDNFANRESSEDDARLIQGCTFLDVSKEKKDYGFGTGNPRFPEEEGEQYSFAGIGGKLVTDISDTELEGKQISFDAVVELGDYFFLISISGPEDDRDNIFSILEGVAKSFEIDDSLINKPDLFLDTDGDGLFDSNELLHGTDINLIDTDGDGYNDKEEINSCNNPLGEGPMTTDNFYNYCIKDIDAGAISLKKVVDNKENLCTIWKPIAKDYIDGLPDVHTSSLSLYSEEHLYELYPDACAEIDTLIGDNGCLWIDTILFGFCPR